MSDMWRQVDPVRAFLMSEVYDEQDDTWPIVVVQWRDAAGGSDGWVDTATYKPEETHVLTVGWVWPQCLEGHLTLVSSVVGVPYEPETVGEIVHIPWECVCSMYSLAAVLPLNWEDENF